MNKCPSVVTVSGRTFQAVGGNTVSCSCAALILYIITPGTFHLKQVNIELKCFHSIEGNIFSNISKRGFWVTNRSYFGIQNCISGKGLHMKVTQVHVTHSLLAIYCFQFGPYAALLYQMDTGYWVLKSKKWWVAKTRLLLVFSSCRRSIH